MNQRVKKILSIPFSMKHLCKKFLSSPDVCVVLSFHRVLPIEHHDYRYTEPELVISEKLFVEYIRILSELTEVLDAKKFVDWTFGRYRMKRACALITFDDGWKDVIDFAAEPLKKLGLPAVVFACPGSIEGGEKSLWFEEVYRLLLRSVEFGRNLRFIETGKSPKGVAKRTLEKLKRKSKIERDETVQKLRESAQIADEPARILNWDDLKKLIAVGIEPHCHTLAHEILTHLSDSEIRANLEGCRRLMVEKIGFLPSFLAYPNGEADERVAKIVQGCGFEIAFTTLDARAARDRTNALFIPRRVMSQITVPSSSLFVWKLLGLP